MINEFVAGGGRSYEFVAHSNAQGRRFATLAVARFPAEQVRASIGTPTADGRTLISVTKYVKKPQRPAGEFLLFYVAGRAGGAAQGSGPGDPVGPTSSACPSDVEKEREKEQKRRVDVERKRY